MQSDQSFWIGIRERPQQNAVDDREYDRCRSDAECEHEQRDRRKARHSTECANREPRVLQQVLSPTGPPCVAALLLHLLWTAEREPRLAPCFVGVYSTRYEVGDALILVKAQLLFEL